MLKVSAFQLDKQKSFIPKKKSVLVKELSLNSCKVRNGGPFLKSRVSEIRVNQIRVNQGLSVY